MDLPVLHELGKAVSTTLVAGVGILSLWPG